MFKVNLDAIPSYIFRTYDIRGNTLSALTADLVHDIALVLGSELQARGSKAILLGRDGRLSSPALFEALKIGLLESGCDLTDLGLVPTPVLYFATHTTGIRSGVMLTGSHNPKDDNGLKIVLNGETLNESGIQGLLTRLKKRDYVRGQGSYQVYPDILSQYVKQVTKIIHLERPLKIVIDAGNGATSVVAPSLFQALGCNVTPLYCEVDGHFPNHHPDPSKPQNVAKLIATVAEQGADLGLAFDGDGDRLGVVTSQGKMIYPDRQLMLLARSVLPRYPGATIVYDVKCSSQLEKVIQQAGGVPCMSRTGHSLIKKKLLETNSPLSGEMSGHIFFQDRWYGFDDGQYVGARILEILSQTKQNADELFNTIPDSINTPELNIAIAEEKKYQFIEQLVAAAQFDNAKIITIDGLRIEFPDGWGLVRASNTTPLLTLRFEAQDETALEAVKARFRALLLTVDPSLAVNF